MCRRGWLALLLILSGAGLRALAAASPMDPLWLPGVYDAADFDDVVLAVRALDGSRDDTPAPLEPPARLAVEVARLRPIALRSLARSFEDSRAPPAS